MWRRTNEGPLRGINFIYRQKRLVRVSECKNTQLETLSKFTIFNIFLSARISSQIPTIIFSMPKIDSQIFALKAKNPLKFHHKYPTQKTHWEFPLSSLNSIIRPEFNRKFSLTTILLCCSSAREKKLISFL
jgi:hypothetical protein